MKARTKLELRVVGLSNDLQRITDSQKNWAYKEWLPHKGFANKSNAFCLDCGQSFCLSLIKRKKAVCPHCQTLLSIEQTRKTTDQQTNYFAIGHLVEDFQVIENYELIAYYKKGKQVKYYLHAILEYWILPNGKTTMIGLNHNTSGYCDSWLTGGWEIRKATGNYYSYNKYLIYASKYHPESEFKTEYQKLGIDSNLSGLSFLEAIKLLPFNQRAETLLKAKQYRLFAQCLDNGGLVSRYWNSIKICLRNKYKFNDVKIWFDYLELLRYFNKDINSPKYICPKSLNKAHDLLVKKKRIIQKAEEAEQKKQKAILDQQKFLKDKAAFFGLQFTDGNITVKVLESIEEVINEGDVLHHCVFTNGYHLKENSLILSARIDGKPIETIEFLLDKFKISQSRGLQNAPSPYNKQILQLVKKNIPKIKTRYKQLKQTA